MELSAVGWFILRFQSARSIRYGIVAEAPPVSDEARRGWRSGQNRAALQAEKRFWEPQEDVTFVGCDKSKQKHAFPSEVRKCKELSLRFCRDFFSLPFLLTVVLCLSLSLSIIFAFLLSASWALFSEHLYLKQLHYCLFATLLLSQGHRVVCHASLSLPFTFSYSDSR